MDGIIVQATGLGERYSEVSEWNVPFVFAGRPLDVDGVSFVDVDNLKGAYNAVAHLAQNGYQKIATVTGALNTTVGIDRLAGYRQALYDRGLEISDHFVVEGDFSEFGAYFATKRLLQYAPDAIFCASDTMAIGVMKALKDEGLFVPHDIALVGFHDLLPASINSPQLTTVRQPICQFGFKAIETLIDIIENGPQPPRRIMFETELVIRGSCGSQPR